jgi:Tfp pilus assembly protein PilV
MRSKRGIALLEVLAAVAIAGIVAVSTMGQFASALRAMRQAAAEESQQARAQRVMTDMTLLRRDELDRWVGYRAVGPFAVGVSRPERDLYRIAIHRGASSGSLMLVTVVYRRGLVSR